MDNLATPEIIQAASSSNLGIFSLMILVLGIIALTFFRRSQPWVQLAAFTPLFLGVAGFGYAVMGADSSTDMTDISIQPSEASSVSSSISETKKEVTYDETNVSIIVETGTSANSGTNAYVSVNLVGELGSKVFKLDNYGDDRKNGGSDTYNLNYRSDIGQLLEATFKIQRQENQADLDDWLIKSITVKDENRDKERKKEVNRWIGDSNTTTTIYKMDLRKSS